MLRVWIEKNRQKISPHPREFSALFGLVHQPTHPSFGEFKFKIFTAWHGHEQIIFSWIQHNLLKLSVFVFANFSLFTRQIFHSARAHRVSSYYADKLIVLKSYGSVDDDFSVLRRRVTRVGHFLLDKSRFACLQIFHIFHRRVNFDLKNCKNVSKCHQHERQPSTEKIMDFFLQCFNSWKHPVSNMLAEILLFSEYSCFTYIYNLIFN